MIETKHTQMTTEAVKSLPKDVVRVLVTDDSSVVRKLFSQVIEKDPRLVVAGSAKNGQELLDLLNSGVGPEVDVITLDIEMPIMDGITALPQVARAFPHIRVLMASSLTTEGATIALEALRKGAVDYVAKPTSSGIGMNSADEFARDLVEKLATIGKTAPSYRRRNIAVGTVKKAREGLAPASAPASAPKTISRIINKPRAVAIGSSTGGPNALYKIFGELKGKIFDCPVFLTQHMPPKFTETLAKQMSVVSGMVCKEGEQGEEAKPGVVYVAPGGYHMQPVLRGGKVIIELNQDDPENFCRPAVDPMVRSLTDIYKKDLLLLILTGMGSDGVESAKRLVESNGNVISQDKETSVVWGMPKAVVEAGICTEILPLEKIAARMAEILRK